MTAPTSRVVRVFISSTFRDFGDATALPSWFAHLRQRW
jgi:hypothetical protein